MATAALLIGGGLLAGAIGSSLIKKSQDKGGIDEVPVPTRNTAQVDAARRRQKAQAAQMRGRQSTILTGPGGGPSELISQRQTLLGGIQ